MWLQTCGARLEAKEKTGTRILRAVFNVRYSTCFLCIDSFTHARIPAIVSTRFQFQATRWSAGQASAVDGVRGVTVDRLNRLDYLFYFCGVGCCVGWEGELAFTGQIIENMHYQNTYHTYSSIPLMHQLKLHYNNLGLANRVGWNLGTQQRSPGAGYRQL